GGRWAVKDFTDAAELDSAVTIAPAFAVSPQGKFAAALYGRELTLWTWHDGKWTKGPNLVGTGAFSSGSFFVTDKGRMWYLRGEELQRITFPGAPEDSLDGPPDKDAEMIAALITQLGDEEFSRREEASKKLQ